MFCLSKRWYQHRGNESPWSNTHELICFLEFRPFEFSAKLKAKEDRKWYYFLSPNCDLVMHLTNSIELSITHIGRCHISTGFTTDWWAGIMYATVLSFVEGVAIPTFNVGLCVRHIPKAHSLHSSLCRFSPHILIIIRSDSLPDSQKVKQKYRGTHI